MAHDILVDLYSTLIDYAVASRNKFVLDELRKSVPGNIERSVLERLWGRIRYMAESIRLEASSIYGVIEELDRCIRRKSLIHIPAGLNWPQYIFDEFIAVTDAALKEINAIFYGVAELLEKSGLDNVVDALAYAGKLYHYVDSMERVRRGADALREAAKYICGDDATGFIIQALSETVIMIGGYRRFDPAVLMHSIELRPIVMLEEIYPVAKGLRNAMVKRIVDYLGEILAPA